MPEIKLINYWYYHDFKFDAENHPQTAQVYRERAADPRYVGS